MQSLNVIILPLSDQPRRNYMPEERKYPENPDSISEKILLTIF